MAVEHDEQIMVRLPSDLLRQLRARCQDEERTVAQTVRMLIKRYLGGQ